jgi:hypothetical protein
MLPGTPVGPSPHLDAPVGRTPTGRRIARAHLAGPGGILGGRPPGPSRNLLPDGPGPSKGILARMTVPPPGRDSIAIEPPSSPARSSIPDSPSPEPDSPGPDSRLAIETPPVVLHRRPARRPARTPPPPDRPRPECFATFVIASCTIRYSVVSTARGSRHEPAPPARNSTATRCACSKSRAQRSRAATSPRSSRTLGRRPARDPPDVVHRAGRHPAQLLRPTADGIEGRAPAPAR